MNTYVCTICGFTYEEAAGIPAAGIDPGTPWEALPADWVCPICGADKAQFKKLEPENKAANEETVTLNENELGELSMADCAAICANMSRGCEKQYLSEEAALFAQLAEYFNAKIPKEAAPSVEKILEKDNQSLETTFPEAFSVAKANGDRGALRALTWAEKVSRIQSSIMDRYTKDGDAMLENTDIYVCESCGFIYVGDNPPEVCPVCKVPNRKLIKVERS